MGIVLLSKKFSASISIFVLMAAFCPSEATCAEESLDFGFPSFESFASSGTQTASATDVGAVFTNPAALQNTGSYFVSHSFAGFSKRNSFVGGAAKLESQSSWSALGAVWRPEKFLGQLAVGAGYYIPNTLSIDQSVEIEAFRNSNSWGTYMRAQSFSRRAGIGISYLASPSWSFGATCSGLWSNQQMLVSNGADVVFNQSGSDIEVKTFTFTRSSTDNVMLEGIAGIRFNLNSNLSVGAAWESPLKMLSTKNSNTVSGLSGSITTDSSGKVSANNQHINFDNGHEPISLKQTPQQQRIGVSWQDDGTVLSFGLNRRSGFTSEYDENLSATVDWSAAARYPISSSSAAHVSLRTNYFAVPSSERSVGNGSVELRGGGSVRIGDTEFALGLSYVRDAKNHVLDLSVPETGRALQALLGVNSYFM